jgi:hypothetical protein
MEYHGISASLTAERTDHAKPQSAASSGEQWRLSWPPGKAEDNGQRQRATHAQ